MTSVMNDADLKARLSTGGIEDKRGGSAELAALIKHELIDNQRLAKAAGIRAE